MRNFTLSGLAVVLASALGCSGEEPQESQDELLERPAIIHPSQPTQTQQNQQVLITSSNYFLAYPTLQDLEDAVNLSTDDLKWKEDLLALSAKGDEFHERIQSSLGMSLLYLNGFEYSFKNKQENYETALYYLDWVRTTIEREVQLNANGTTEFITYGLNANREISDILHSAQDKGHLSNVGKVIGYLVNASVISHYVFNSFGFFYETDLENDGARVAFENKLEDKAKLEEMRDEAKVAYNALPLDIKLDIIGFVGKQVHNGLMESTLKLLDKPQDAPRAPSEKEEFYRQFGQELFAKYGLMDTTQQTNN
ncbi:hypothetical protein J4434_08445 [Candidatus Woesearchaeota archaeon]|nr:hypothetical protein [Candidatus Woesearchaeota archaeon]